VTARAAAAHRLDRRGAWALLAALGTLVAINEPELGSDPWPFRPPFVHAHGLLGPLVRAAGEKWDHGFVRTPAILAGLLLALVAAATWRRRTWPRLAAVTLAAVVVAALLVPGVLLQVGLRQATAPWFHTNDSTYQIELAGDLVLHGHTPYGYDYSHTGLERFYSRNGTVPPGTREHQVALRHFAYFPGTALAAAAWRVLPHPLDDFRLLVLLTSFATLFAAFVFDAALWLKLSLGAALAANPLAVRAAWFGTADAPAVLFLVLAFALVTRRRYVAAAAGLALAVLLKQFALVAVPFLAVMLLVRRVPRPVLVRAGVTFAAIVVAGFLPFLVADPGALWDDTVAYGGTSYRIIGFGLAGLLVKAGVIEDRFDPYPFAVVALLTWVPLTAWLLWNQLRSRVLWTGAAAFSISIFVLLFVGRVFQNSYLVWPLAGILCACLLEPADRPARYRLGTRP
jgi:hypothetical protein